MRFNQIHRIWLGGEMPDRYKEYGSLWRELNPYHSLHDWTEEEIMDGSWHNQKVLDDMYANSKKPGADMIAYYTHVADVVDYELLYKTGGWYFNTDLRPIKPLSVLSIDYNIPTLAMEDDIHPVNMAMYSPKESEFFAKVIELLPVRYFGMPGAFMNATTGVQLLQHAIREYNGPVRYLPRQVFNPIHWSEFDYGTMPDTDRDFPEETVAIHEWLHRTNQRGQRVIE